MEVVGRFKSQGMKPWASVTHSELVTGCPREGKSRVILT